ncbi:unnamed protein product [Rhizoctonia solani]|uniref:Uncharacterized protein n=1 Tax=Rhizoctonia solani TaxID=456999 RepID=A0A8H3E262_9AGAM|nr:unnamed protein product [Rhizoctonia solani]
MAPSSLPPPSALNWGLTASVFNVGAIYSAQDDKPDGAHGSIAKISAETGGDLPDVPKAMSGGRKSKAVATAVDIDEEDQPVYTKQTGITKRVTRNSKK